MNSRACSTVHPFSHHKKQLLLLLVTCGCATVNGGTHHWKIVVEALPNVKNCGCGQSFSTRSGGRPGPRPGFRVLTGSILIFKKIQNGVVLVKKKKLNGLQPGFWPDFAGSAGSWLMQFFHQPGLVPAPGRVSKH
jgi:hypothetical protein